LADLKFAAQQILTSPNPDYQQLGRIFGGELFGVVTAVAVPAAGKAAIKLGTSAAAALQALRSGANEIIGEWVAVNESMSANSAAYQAFVTGAKPGYAFVVNGVKFDGKTGGTLLEAKGNFDFAVDSSGSFKPWFSGAGSMIEQATNQLQAANGAPIMWYAQTPATASAISKLFQNAGIKIPVIFKPGPG